jgi:hypothetical protein
MAVSHRNLRLRYKLGRIVQFQGAISTRKLDLESKGPSNASNAQTPIFKLENEVVRFERFARAATDFLPVRFRRKVA